MPSLLREYGKLCAWALAKAHAPLRQFRPHRRYMGSRAKCSTRRSREFAVEYADQAERDYRAFVKAIREGRIAVVSED